MNGTKVHVAIKTAKIASSIEFYRELFGVEPLKKYADYAKFDLAAPGLNLTLNEVASQPTEQAIDHLGIEFGSREEVADVIKSLETKGIPHQVQQETTCCYGMQDKVWVADPNGVRWELYTILEADTGAKACDMQPVAVAASQEASGSC